MFTQRIENQKVEFLHFVVFKVKYFKQDFLMVDMNN